MLDPEATNGGADCCGTPDPRIGSHFDHLTRQRTAGGVMPPMVNVSARLLDQLSDVAEVRPSVLELGCGSAGLMVALLSRGATRADGVDLSPEALAVARRRADAAGIGQRATFELGDAARATLVPHDWVVLDRVICCYPDVEALLGNAIAAATKRFAYSVPRSRGLWGLFNRVGWGFEAFIANLQHGPCPGYVHSLDRIESRLSAAGFVRRSTANYWLWYTAVWERA
jgi:magnesium-protoporphyrin O-methyltransferase